MVPRRVLWGDQRGAGGVQPQEAGSGGATVTGGGGSPTAGGSGAGSAGAGGADAPQPSTSNAAASSGRIISTKHTGTRAVKGWSTPCADRLPAANLGLGCGRSFSVRSRARSSSTAARFG